MSRRAPSPMWIEVTIGVSLKAGTPGGAAWTVETLAAKHGFDPVAVSRAVDALAGEGLAEAIAMKSSTVAASIPAAATSEGRTGDAAPLDVAVQASPVPEITGSLAKPCVEVPAAIAVGVERGSRLAGGRTPVEAGGVPPLAPSAPSFADIAAVEARQAGARRRLARAASTVATGSQLSPIKVAIETEMLAKPEDGFAFLRRKWPQLLHRVVADGHVDGETPGPMLARVIEAGLARLAEKRNGRARG